MRLCRLDSDADVLASHPIPVPAYHFRARQPSCVEVDEAWLGLFELALIELDSRETS